MITQFKMFENGIRDEYTKMGVHNYYDKHRDSYVNPHLDNIQLSLDWVMNKLKISDFIDLSCANGAVFRKIDSRCSRKIES